MPTITAATAKAQTPEVEQEVVEDDQYVFGKYLPLGAKGRSGRTAAALCAQWEVLPEDVLVIFDDFLLDFGRLRFRRGGSDGGHNGLASVLEALNTEAVPRLRLGIGIPPADADVVDYVLDPFSPEDEVEDLIERGNAALEVYYAEGIEAAMNKFNG